MRNTCLILALGFSLHASTLFDTSPPNSNAADITDARLADFFNLASNSTVSSINFWYQVAAFGSQADLSILSFDIYKDAGGALGTDIVSGVTTLLNESYDSANNAYLASFNLGSSPLSAGGYWLELHAGSSDTDTSNNNTNLVVWWAASDVSNTWAALQNSGTGLPNAALLTPGYETYAFQIIGTQNGGGQTPEPSTSGLVALGASALWVWKMRRSS